MSLRAVACRLGSIVVVVGVVVAAAALATLSPGTRKTALADSCPASGPPCPANAYVTLSVSAGGPNTTIGVSGGQFLPGQSMSLYWDSSNQVIGSATANGQGSWGWVNVKPFAGQQPGVHRICASVTPQPCAQFQLEGIPTPSPVAVASPSESPSPLETPSPSESPTPIPIPAASNTGGLDLILKPPLVFLPLAGLAGLIAAVAWWLFTVFPRQQRTLTAASVTHRSTRPTWGGESATAQAEHSRPAWPTMPSPPPQPEPEPEQASWPDFPQGTDDRPHWAPPRPSIPDDEEETAGPEG